MAVVMIVCGILAGAVHYFHYRQRSTIKLFAPPGSIAVAASATQDSAVHGIIKNGWDEKRFRSALVGQTFGMDSTGRIVALGNEVINHGSNHKYTNMFNSVNRGESKLC